MSETITQSERLRQFNRWRRGEEDIPQPDPKELGELLDSVADRLEALESLRDATDRCYRMLMSEPDTKGALFNAENMLREAMIEARGGKA